jgi:hypothetical protein
MKSELATMSIRLSRESIGMLDEQSSLLNSTRTHLIRNLVAESLRRWQSGDRRKAIESLVSTINSRKHLDGKREVESEVPEIESKT